MVGHPYSFTTAVCFYPDESQEEAISEDGRVTHTSKICYLNLLVHTDERKFIQFTLNLQCGANKRARVRDFLSYISIGNPMNAVEFSQNCTSLLASAI